MMITTFNNSRFQKLIWNIIKSVNNIDYLSENDNVDIYLSYPVEKFPNSDNINNEVR